VGGARRRATGVRSRIVLVLSSEDIQPRRTAGEIGAIVATTVLTAAASIALLFGPALIAGWWVARDGITTFTLTWIAISAAWILLLASAAVEVPKRAGRSRSGSSAGSACSQLQCDAVESARRRADEKRTMVRVLQWAF
jgi:hypothetical protein